MSSSSAARWAKVRRPSDWVRGAVGDRPRHELRRPLHDPPALQRLARVGGELRLDPHDAGGRVHGPDRRRDAAGQPAATDRHEHGRQVRQRFGDLEAAGALAGDDPVVVVGRDDRQATLAGEALGRPSALLARRTHGHDLRAVGRDPGPLDGGGVVGHHDDGRRAEEARRPGDALGMVAAGVGDDPALAGGRVERGDRDVGAPELERPDRLERLRLEQPAAVRRTERHERRTERDPLEGPSGGPDPVDPDEPGRRSRRSCRPQRDRPSVRWQSMQWDAHGSASSRSAAIGRRQDVQAP